MEISSESHDPLTKLTKAENLLVLRCRAIRIEVNKSEPTVPANWFAFHVLAERRFENLLRLVSFVEDKKLAIRTRESFARSIRRESSDNRANSAKKEGTRKASANGI